MESIEERESQEGLVGAYVPDGYVQSESEQQSSCISQGEESAVFCQTTIQDEEYCKKDGAFSENQETQEDEVVSGGNPMDSHILN